MKKSPPNWLTVFTDEVTQSIHAHDVMSPLGCHFHREGEVWEITIFAARTEIVGGPQDGRTTHSRFDVDIKPILDQFSEVSALYWQAQSLGSRDELGPHVAIEGIHKGRQIWLRVTSTAPRRFGPGRRAMVNLERIEELW